MNKQILTWVAVATLSLNLQVARAADMTLNLYQEYALFGTGSSGTLWLGNFGTNGVEGSLLSSSQVDNLLANDKQALFNLFRPVAPSFSIANGRIAGVGAGSGLLSATVNVGSALVYDNETGEPQLPSPTTSSQFAGQDLYLLANNRVGATANSWFNETLILFKAAASFGSGDSQDGPLNTPEVEFSTDGGTLLIGTQDGSPSVNLASGTIAGAVVPEPSSASLLLVGATALVALRRLRKNV